MSSHRRSDGPKCYDDNEYFSYIMSKMKFLFFFQYFSFLNYNSIKTKKNSMWWWQRIFSIHYVKNEISFRFSLPNTSSQNIKAKRIIRSINNIFRTILAYAFTLIPLAPYSTNDHISSKYSLKGASHQHKSPHQIICIKISSYSHLNFLVVHVIHFSFQSHK